MTLRHTVAAAVAACLLFVPRAGAADEGGYPPPWPAGDVTFTVPFVQGSEVDALRALLKDNFAARTGKRFTARYVDGRAGADAWARIVDDPLDGTVLTAVILPDAYLRSLQPDSGVSLASMAISNVIAHMPCVLWAPVDGPYGSVNDVLAAAAAKSGDFTVAGSGRFSASQIASRSLDRQGGVRSLYIPYSGTIAAATAVAKGQAEVFWGYSVPVTLPIAEFKPLAVAAGSRLPSMPDVPTFRELGLEVVQGVFIALAVPAETPRLTVTEISEYFIERANSAAFRESAVKQGFTPVDVDMESLKVFLAQEIENARKLSSDFSLADQE